MMSGFCMFSSLSAFAGRLWDKCFMYISADKTQYSVKSRSI